MIISMALFGFAASGTFLSIRGIARVPSPSGTTDNRIHLYVVFFSLSTLVSFLILNCLPLDYMELPVEPLQIVLLLAACLLISVPFFFAGMVVSYTYMTMPEQSGRVYFFNMAGSGLGALSVLFLLPFTNEGNLIILAVILPLLPALPFPREVKSLKRKPVVIAASILTAAVVALGILIATPDLLQIRPSPYKSLSQLLLFPDTVATHERTSLRGRVDTVDSPYIRFAPGLSLKFQNNLPKQKAAFIDHDNRLVLPASSSVDDFDFQRQTLAYAGYLIPKRIRNILVIQNSGGSAIACAFSAGARLQVLEKNPILTDLLAVSYPIKVSSENTRSFLNNSSHRFDVIHIESWGASLPGASALSQEYSFTKDAFKAYLSRLNHGGVVVVSRRLLLPPSNMLRLSASACEALLSLNAVPPEHHIAIIRNWDTFTMIVSLNPLKNMASFLEYAKKHNFDLVWPQEANNTSLNRFNAFEKPFHYLKIEEMFAAYNAGDQHRFFDQYPLDVAPQSDDRPFPDKFFKWRKGPDIHKMMGSRFYTLLLSGEIVVLVVLGAALLTALGLLLMPRFASRAGYGSISLNKSVYFLSVGAGFILAELFFIHFYTLVFADPVVSLTAVLSSLLVFSGAGGLVSFHLDSRRIRPVILILGTVIGIMCIFADCVLHNLVLLPSPYGYIMTIVALIPAGLLLGMPFPLGMRFLLNHPRQRAYAWAVNGCASVVSSVIAMQIALSIGLTAILWFAVGAYAIAWLTAKPTAK